MSTGYILEAKQNLMLNKISLLSHERTAEWKREGKDFFNCQRFRAACHENFYRYFHMIFEMILEAMPLKIYFFFVVISGILKRNFIFIFNILLSSL